MILMKSKKQVIQAKQYDKNVPIEFFRIENNQDIFDSNNHYQFDFYQIYWFTDASNKYHQIDFVTYAIESDQIWIIYPGQVHHFDSTDISGYYLVIDKDYFHRVLFKEAKQKAFTGSSHLKFIVTTEMQQLFEHLNQLIEIEFHSFKRASVLEKYIQLYILHLQDLPVEKLNHVNIDTRIHTLLELIEQYYITHRKNEFYAGKVSLSSKRMNEILIQSIGKSLKQNLQDRLLLEAKRLVGYSNDNIQEIADKLCFSEVTYFNRFFKKHTNQTPLDFRQKVKKVQE